MYFFFLRATREAKIVCQKSNVLMLLAFSIVTAKKAASLEMIANQNPIYELPSKNNPIGYQYGPTALSHELNAMRLELNALRLAQRNENAMQNDKNAMRTHENAMRNDEDALQNDKNAMRNEENALQNDESVQRKIGFFQNDEPSQEKYIILSCAKCGANFKRKTTWQIYCSDVCRFEANKKK